MSLKRLELLALMAMSGANFTGRIDKAMHYSPNDYPHCSRQELKKVNNLRYSENRGYKSTSNFYRRKR